MSTLRLAGPDDLDRVTKMVATHHAEAGIAHDEERCRHGLVPLLDGVPNGAVWLIGPRSAPVGYVAVSFGWSIARGGLEATIDALFIREKVRGRGMGGEALLQLAKALSQQGVCALHVSTAPQQNRARSLFLRCGFAPREAHHMISQLL